MVSFGSASSEVCGVDGVSVNLVDRLAGIGIVPVVSLPDAQLAPPLAEALLEAGLACAEITFRTDAAAAAMALIRRRLPELLLGAGTVLTTRQADLAIDSGAEFIVAPGTSPTVVDYVLRRGVPMIPGVATPTDIDIALAHGIDLVKFFPAEQFGGVATIKAFAGPYPRVRYIPTGGISPANLGAYLAVPQVVACGGSWMVKADLLLAGDFAAITQLAREAVAIAEEAHQGRFAGHSGGGQP
jgi:2-dehydro-3-deoxyphosphogluconate aldolase/(4S)-4-hydroxy-2-oxoglutarate aldolase